MRIISLFCFLLVTLFFGSVFVHASEDAARDRQALMSHVGAATGLGSKLAKGDIPFDLNSAQFVMRTLNAAALSFGYMFPEGSETGHKTEASPSIWSDRSGFNEAIKKFGDDTSGTFTDLSGFRGVFGAATSNCGSCHRSYRVKR